MPALADAVRPAAPSAPTSHSACCRTMATRRSAGWRWKSCSPISSACGCCGSDSAGGAPCLMVTANFQQRLLDSLPFRLTGAQRRVLAQYVEDLAQRIRRCALGAGDVGSERPWSPRKWRPFAAWRRGCRVALMAPPSCWRNSTCATSPPGRTHWASPSDG